MEALEFEISWAQRQAQQGDDSRDWGAREEVLKLVSRGFG
jgi:hypothetical protein